jgi:hypothetical protein
VNTARRGECGVQLTDYDTLREPLLCTLEQMVGEDSHVREVWTVCCDELAVDMEEAAGVRLRSLTWR